MLVKQKKTKTGFSSLISHKNPLGFSVVFQACAQLSQPCCV